MFRCNSLKLLFIGTFIGSALAISTIATASELSDSEVKALRAEAQQLVANKKPEEALTKIVQVILARPADLPARFFRSQILVSMGRGEEVKSELEVMTTLNIPEADKNKARQLIEAIEKMGRKFAGSITLKAGFGYGDNINSWPEGGETTSKTGVNAAMPDSIYEKYQKISDTIRTASFSFNGSYILNEARTLKTNFGLSTSYKNGADTVSIDNKLTSVRFGLQNDFASGTTVKTKAVNTSLNRVNDKNGTAVTSDLKITSLDFDISHKVTKKVSVGYKLASAQYRNSNITNAKNSDSNNLTNSLYVGSPLGATAFGRLTVSKTTARANETTTAAKDKVNKDTSSVSALLVKVLPKNQRIIATASASEGKHLRKNVSSSGTKRLDKTKQFTIGYTIKGKEIWKRLGDVTFGLDGTYSKTTSNQASARVNARTVAITIAKKFEM